MPLTPPEPDQLTLLGKLGGYVGAAATVAGSAIAAGIAFFKTLNGRIVAVDKKVDTKASEDDMKKARADIGRVFEQQREDKADILKQMREDNGGTRKAIEDLTGSFHNFSLQVAQEMGKRPTRDEVGEFVEDKVAISIAREKKLAHG